MTKHGNYARNTIPYNSIIRGPLYRLGARPSAAHPAVRLDFCAPPLGRKHPADLQNFTARLNTRNCPLPGPTPAHQLDRHQVSLPEALGSHLARCRTRRSNSRSISSTSEEGMKRVSA